MGNFESKIGKKECEEIQEGNVASTPILTTKLREVVNEVNNLDPRSPSQFISRTPIQLLNVAADQLETLQSSFSSLPTPDKNIRILGIDPRSPAVDFNRTPIIISASPDKKLPLKLHNKNLDNVLKNTILTPKKTATVPPRLLESSPIIPKPDLNKRRSLVGLLETNIDFTETDLDEVLKEKYSPNEEKIDIVQNENIDPRSPTTAFVRTPLQIIKKIGEIDLNKTVEDCASDEDEGRSVQDKDEGHSVGDKAEGHSVQDKDEGHSVGDKAEGHSVEDKDEGHLVKDKDEGHCVNSKEGCQKSIDEEILEVEIKPFSNENVGPETNKEDIAMINHVKSEPNLEECSEHIIETPVTPTMTKTSEEMSSEPKMSTPHQFIDITADVKELDKKLTNLIYEDDPVICPRIVKVKEQSRTPLSDRNGAESKKSMQRLKVSDKPRKSEFAVSKIPVFKDKKGACENTPPRNMDKRKNKPKKSQWDNDKTLVI